MVARGASSLNAGFGLPFAFATGYASIKLMGSLGLLLSVTGSLGTQKEYTRDRPEGNPQKSCCEPVDTHNRAGYNREAK